MKIEIYDELIERLRGVVQSAERGELVIREFQPSRLFPGCLGPSRVNEDATKYMISELKATLEKADSVAKSTNPQPG